MVMGMMRIPWKWDENEECMEMGNNSRWSANCLPIPPFRYSHCSVFKFLTSSDFFIWVSCHTLLLQSSKPFRMLSTSTNCQIYVHVDIITRKHANCP
jgi:hypothetical protein